MDFCATETKLKLSISFPDLYLQGIIRLPTGEESATKRWVWIVPAGEFTSPSSSQRGMHRYPSAKWEHLGWRPTKISTKTCLRSTHILTQTTYANALIVQATVWTWIKHYFREASGRLHNLFQKDKSASGSYERSFIGVTE